LSDFAFNSADFLIVSKSIDKRWENQHKIQCEWSFEVMKNVNRVERIKQCLQEILSLKDVLEESVVSNQEAAAMHFRLGNILAGEGMYDEAILHYETTLEVQRSLGSESVLDLSNTLHNYGNVLYKNKQHEFALAAYQESLRLAQSKLGSDQDEIAETMSCIGNVYHKLKVIDDAKQYYTESIRIRRNLFGKDDPSILGPLLNLATIQIKCGEDEAAMKSFKQILQISKAASRGESFEVATALQGIAKIHAKNAVDYNKAISCLQAALHIWNAIYGASHVKVADTTLELGVVYDRLGDFYQARELYDEALAQYILLKGEESLQVAKVLFSIGLVLDETNQQEAAVENLQKALRIYTVQSLGCCEGAGDCLHNLGVAYYKMGFLDKALTSYDSALSAYAQSLAQNDLKTARSLHAKGVVLTQMACTEEALTCFRHSHDIFLEKGSGTENVEGEIGESKYCIGKLLLQRGSFDDALNMLEDALLLKERVEQQSVNNSNDRLSVANILHSQGLIYASRGAHVEAINRFQRSLKVLAEISGAINGRSTISKTNYQLGCSLQELGECQEAMECFEESLRNLESHQEAAGDERVEQQQTSRASDESNILLHKGQVHLQFNDHIEQAWECFQKSLELRQSSIEANDDVFMAHNLIGFGRCLHQQGKYADALDYYNRAISLYSSSSPSLQQFEGAPHNIHLEIARLHHLIGTAKYHLGQQDEAILNLTEALQLFNTLFRHSKDNTEVSMTLHAIGLVFFQQHKTDDAVQSLEKAFDIQVRLGSYNQHFMLITQDLAKLYALQGQSDKALPLLKNLTETYESLSPDKQSSLVKHVISCYEVFLDILMKYSGCSLEVAHLYIRLGSALGSNSNYRQSIHCFHKALKIQTDVFGQDDLTLAPTLHNLGVAEAKAGELLEAEHHLRRSMDNMRATLKRDNYEVAETLSCLADVLYQQSRYEDAIRFYRESASIQRSLVPAAAPNGQSLKLAQTLFKLGLVVESLKNYKAATACYQECFDIQSSVLGPHHPQIDTVLLHMGNISRAQNDFRKAIEHYQSSLEIKQRSPSKKENFSIANILYNMGSAHALLGENESANALFQRALAIYHKVLGSKIIANRSTMTDPTDVPEHEESVDEETETYIMKAVETHRREFDDRLDNADILFNIAALCEQLSDLCTARKFYLLSAKRYRLQQQIQDKFKLSNALYRVGVIYNVSLKLYEPALRYFEECLQIQKNLLGDTHEDVEALLHVIGIVYHKLGVYDLSVRCMEEALAAKNAREGTTPTTDQNSAIFSLATSPHKNSDLPRALALYRDALDKQKSELGENHVYVGRTLHMIGSILKDMGDYMSALDFFTDAMNIFRHQSGSGSLDLANTAFAMGILYFDLKRLDDSMSMYSTSLEERKIRLGDKNVKVGATLNNMGAVHYEMGNYEKAVIFFSNALEIFGPDHEGSGHIYSGLAYAYRELGKKKEASDFFERAIRKESESLGPDHIDIGDLLHNYGTFLADDCNKFIESARYLEESLRIKVLNIGYESLEVSESLFQLSKVYDKTGRLGGAVEALTKSIAIRESYLLEGDPNKKDILCVLLHHVDFLLQLMDSNDSPKTAEHDLKKADVFCKKGNFQMIMKNYLEAIECYESSLIIQERILGLASFTVSNTLHNLGSAELKNKDFERAGYHLEQSITIRKKVIDEDDVEVADSLHNLAIAYRHLNDFNKAIQFFEDSSQIKRVRLGNNALSLAETLYEMGSALLEIENYEKSMRCFLDCLRIRRLKLGVEHLSVSNALFCIGHIHKRRLENSRALQVYRETLKIRRKILGYDSPEIASVLFNMASVLDSLKDYEDALKCYEECQNILERITGQEDLKVATVLLNLGRILAEVEGYVEALECYQQCLQIRQSKLGKEALEVAEVLLYIGMTEEKLSFDDIAMGRYVSALKILENFSGVESSESVARVMYGMALIYAKKSDYDNAFKFANESARIWSTMETSNLLEDVADLYFLLGSLHQLRGDVDDALTLFSQSEQLYRRRLGNEHIAVGNSLYSMGLMKEVKGSHSEAITLFQESLKIKQRLLGADDIDVGHLYYKIGVLTKLQCEYDEASKMLEQALRIQSFNLGAVCEEVGHTELMLGNVYESLLRWDNAADSLENALMIFRELNADPLLLANVLSALGRVRDELGNLEKAIQLFEDSIRLYQQELLQERYQLLEINDERGSHDPTDHSDVIEEKLRRLHLDFADTYFNLGSAYDKAQNGNEEKALGLYRASLEMYVKLIGKDCVDVAKVLSCMGILYAKSGNYVLSRRLLTESLRIRELFFGRDSLEAAASLFALGVVHDKVAEYTKALDCYTEVLRIRQSILGENCVEVAETLTNLGVAEGNMGNLERSLQHWKNSVLIYKRCGFNDDDDAVIAIKANMDVAERSIEMISQVNMYL
jgi:tetratricopeptide (TPR) repeat protein